MKYDLNYTLYLSGLISENRFYDICERSAQEIKAMPAPKDGRWLGNNNYVFNIEGDDCVDDMGNRRSSHCYNVKFDAYGNGVSISFDRVGSYGDQNLGLGQQVFDGVRKAVSEYIAKNKPELLKWSPILSKEGKESRSKAYEIWSVKALWPELYVSPSVNLWMRRDVYDKQYVPSGYPPVPPDAKKTLKSLNDFRNSTSVLETKFNKLLTSRTYRRSGYMVVKSDPQANKAIIYHIEEDGKWNKEYREKTRVRELLLDFSPASTMDALRAADQMIKAGQKEQLDWFPPELVTAYQSEGKRMALGAAKTALGTVGKGIGLALTPLDAADQYIRPKVEKQVEKIASKIPSKRTRPNTERSDDW